MGLSNSLKINHLFFHISLSYSLSLSLSYSFSQEAVMGAIEKVCLVLPKTLSAQCKDLIETYGQAIIDLLVQEADPKTVCALLGLCKDADRLLIRTFVLNTN